MRPWVDITAYSSLFLQNRIEILPSGISSLCWMQNRQDLRDGKNGHDTKEESGKVLAKFGSLWIICLLTYCISCKIILSLFPLKSYLPSSYQIWLVWHPSLWRLNREDFVFFYFVPLSILTEPIWVLTQKNKINNIKNCLEGA